MEIYKTRRLKKRRIFFPTKNGEEILKEETISTKRTRVKVYPVVVEVS